MLAVNEQRQRKQAISTVGNAAKGRGTTLSCCAITSSHCWHRQCRQQRRHGERQGNRQQQYAQRWNAGKDTPTRKCPRCQSIVVRAAPNDPVVSPQPKGARLAVPAPTRPAFDGDGVRDVLDCVEEQHWQRGNGHEPSEPQRDSRRVQGLWSIDSLLLIDAHPVDLLQWTCSTTCSTIVVYLTVRHPCARTAAVGILHRALRL